jgi:hypothetical protein
VLLVLHRLIMSDLVKFEIIGRMSGHLRGDEIAKI